MIYKLRGGNSMKEYKMVHKGLRGMKKLEKILNELANDGWKLITTDFNFLYLEKN